MTFRTKLLLVTSLTITGSVALVTGAVSLGIRRTFESMDASRRSAVLERFRKQFDSEGQDVIARVRQAAAGEAVLRVAGEAARPEPDYAPFVNEAAEVAAAAGLEFLDIADPDGRLVSSAHFAARFGYPHGWDLSGAAAGSSFLTRVPVQDGTVLALAALTRVGTAGGREILVLGARRLDASFIAGLEGSPGVRVMLWTAGGPVVGTAGSIPSPGPLMPLLEDVGKTRREAERVVAWPGGPENAESVAGIPLRVEGTVPAVLLVASSLRDQVRLERSILITGIAVGAAGVLLGVLIGWWTTARVTRPVAELVSGARAVAAGDWSARVPVSSHDEIGELSAAFNHMTEQLITQRDRAVQAERVAAWRELARRLAHELKNPLFPLQITVENLRKAHEMRLPEFDEILRESTTTLLAELSNLRTITGRFSDFAKMPAPRFEETDLNSVVTDVARLHAGLVQPVLHLAPAGVPLEADPEQLRRMLSNLVLNARDAMPEGGELRIATRVHDGMARLEVSDTGQGLTSEECERLFTPYYTTKQHGTGLGLAIVQSVVSDHGGRINVSSTPGQGATFTIDLPIRRAP